jgi:hypothetical protein
VDYAQGYALAEPEPLRGDGLRIARPRHAPNHPALAGSGNDSFGGGSGWTDVIQLDVTADPGPDPNSPREITVNGEQVEYDLATNALELDPGSCGTITLSDGSEIMFAGIERIVG